MHNEFCSFLSGECVFPHWAGEMYQRWRKLALLACVKHQKRLNPPFSDILRVQTVVLKFCLYHCVFCLFICWLLFENVYGQSNGGWGRCGWEIGVKGILCVDRNIIQHFFCFVFSWFFSWWSLESVTVLLVWADCKYTVLQWQMSVVFYTHIHTRTLKKHQGGEGTNKWT